MLSLSGCHCVTPGQCPDIGLLSVLHLVQLLTYLNYRLLQNLYESQFQRTLYHLRSVSPRNKISRLPTSSALPSEQLGIFWSISSSYETISSSFDFSSRFPFYFGTNSFVGISFNLFSMSLLKPCSTCITPCENNLWS